MQPVVKSASDPRYKYLKEVLTTSWKERAMRKDSGAAAIISVESKEEVQVAPSKKKGLMKGSEKALAAGKKAAATKRLKKTQKTEVKRGKAKSTFVADMEKQLLKLAADIGLLRCNEILSAAKKSKR